VRRRRRDEPPHLLEVGVRWPPETFLVWKLEGLAANGMRVSLASNRIFDPEARLEGVELLAIPKRQPTKVAAAWYTVRASLGLLVRSPRRLLRLVRGVRRQISAQTRRQYGGTIGHLALCLPLARLRPDVVHFEWHRTAVNYLPLFGVWDCPVTTSCRGSDISVYPHVPVWGYYAERLPEVLSRASAIHCVSESLKREAIAFGLDPAKAWVARPGIDPEVFKPAGQMGRALAEGGDDALRVITVGWLRWEKGYEYALEAIRALLDRGVPVQLEMVGSVPAERRGPMDERQRVLHTVADLGLGDHVHLHGHGSSAEISQRLQANDVLLHASVTEGIPAAIVEAMACGVPVVATNCGGVEEVVTDGVEGFLVAPRQPDELVQPLLRLWRDPGLRERMGQAGRERVLPELTLEHEHRVFQEMYRQVTGA
jgi:colanic acid/amylovoran biosynthesis glycosyltransferase